MSPFQPNNYGKPSPTEPPVAKITRINRPPGSSPSLELQVSIGGLDHKVLLPLDALEDRGLSGPAAVEELRGIRAALEALAPLLKNGQEKE